jgi:hypothetical protein
MMDTLKIGGEYAVKTPSGKIFDYAKLVSRRGASLVFEVPVIVDGVKQITRQRVPGGSFLKKLGGAL